VAEAGRDTDDTYYLHMVPPFPAIDVLDSILLRSVSGLSICDEEQDSEEEEEDVLTRESGKGGQIPSTHNIARAHLEIDRCCWR